MRIDSFSKYSEQGPSSRYRLFQFVKFFREAGVELQIHPLFDERYFSILRSTTRMQQLVRKLFYVPGRFRARTKELAAATGNVIHIEQQLFPYLPFSFEKRFLPAKYIVEFDDAIFLTHPRKFRRVLQNAASVIAGNRFLADYASSYNFKVDVIPTVLDTSHFLPASKHPDSRITIGWSGLEYNFKYLKLIESVLATITKKYPVEVIILSGAPPVGLAFPFQFQKWNPEKEVQQMNEFDIGLMPLATDDWCRGKCGFKLLQYMSLEIPSIASNVGVNSEIVNSGQNGLIANTTEEWHDCLEALIHDESLRYKLGKAARQTVIDRYSADVWFPKILQIYKNISTQN